MFISEQDVLYVSQLARISLSEGEVKAFTAQLERILGFINKLDELDVSGVEPTASILSLENVKRQDTVRQDFTAESILSNAPAREKDFFAVPPVIE
jgi:aspartyl-tRNA(Asn)/glutamyl-tRNA(Gln) amidotransferase subunit C